MLVRTSLHHTLSQRRLIDSLPSGTASAKLERPFLFGISGSGGRRFVVKAGKSVPTVRHSYALLYSTIEGTHLDIHPDLDSPLPPLQRVQRVPEVAPRPVSLPKLPRRIPQVHHLPGNELVDASCVVESEGGVLEAGGRRVQEGSDVSKEELGEEGAGEG